MPARPGSTTRAPAVPRPTTRAQPSPRNSRPSTLWRRAGPTRRPRPEVSRWTPMAADPVAGRVAGHRPGDPDGQGAGQRDVVLVGQDPAQYQGQLAGEDQAEEGRGLQG